MNPSYEIKACAPGQLEEALRLAWSVFSEYEAPEYSPEGIEEFWSYLSLADMKKRIQEEGFRLWVCQHGETTIGMLGARPAPEGCHISLLFVDGAHHRQGIARGLFEAMVSHYRAQEGGGEITANSSPYAVEAYGRLGFCPTGAEETVNGIRFTPMKRFL